MDILKDRGIWIVVVVMFIAGAMYMVIVDLVELIKWIISLREMMKE